MTITERKTRFEMIFKIKSKKSQDVINKFNQIKDFMKGIFNKVFKSLTTDNSSEFADFFRDNKRYKNKYLFLSSILFQ